MTNLSRTRHSLTLDRYWTAATSSAGDVRAMERAVNALSDNFVERGDGEALASLLGTLRARIFPSLAKSKTSRITKALLEKLGEIPDSQSLQISLIEDWREWCRTENRIFLRQTLELRLAVLLTAERRFPAALDILRSLLKELRILDDKMTMMEAQLVESRVHHALRNVPKARAALTGARTAANAIYCPPLQQAHLDLQSGILHAEERDFKTSYSYFLEAFDGYHSLEHVQAAVALRYMLLCKIMLSAAEDVRSLVKGKMALQYAGPDLESMRAIADAYAARSIKDLNKCLEKFKAQLSGDAVISVHLAELYDNLMVENLLRIIEPYSTVEIDRVANLISLDRGVVEARLSKMILDKRFNGILDQGAGNLIVFDSVAEDPTYTAALNTIEAMSGVVDALYAKAKVFK